MNGQTKSQAQLKGSKAKPAAEWKKQLDANQYHIMVEKGTEAPFHNAYWNNHAKGVYVSAATGEVLFSSDDKFESNIFLHTLECNDSSILQLHTNGV